MAYAWDGFKKHAAASGINCSDRNLSCGFGWYILLRRYYELMEGDKDNRGLRPLNWFRGSVSAPARVHGRLWKVDSYHGEISRRSKNANAIGWRFAVIDLVHVVMSFMRNSGDPMVWWGTFCPAH